MEKLSAFFHRIRANEDERQMMFRTLILRSYLVRAWDAAEDGLLTSNDAGGEWFDADSDTPPEEPLRAIVVRQSGGEATDSPYSLLVRVMGHFRKAANGLCDPDWDGLIGHAYITQEFAQEWEDAAAPTGVASSAASRVADSARNDADVLKRHRELDSEGKKPTKQLAKELRISERRVRQIVFRAKKAEKDAANKAITVAGLLGTNAAKKR